ncbi:hypothetical protein D1872_285950 [compost metagenome]
MAACHFVYLVEDDDRIHLFGFDQPLNDTSGHRADVGTSVTAQFIDIFQSAQCDTDQLTLQGCSDRVGK